MIEVRNLRKSFGNHVAVNDVSFHIRKGEFYSLLGPNGAGKTSTISMLSTLLIPDAGDVFINGRSIKGEEKAMRKMLGVVPQEIALYEDLTAFENLLFFGSLYDIPKDLLRIRINTLLGDFGLLDRAHHRVREYSGGMKRRINIAAALVHDPAIVFMDEPTVGIDPQSRNNIYEAILSLKKKGITILYTTHYMEEAERFSDRIGIIDNGKIIAEGNLAELGKTSRSRESVVVDCEALPDGVEKNFDLGAEIQIQRIGEQMIFRAEQIRKEVPRIMSACFDAGIDIRNVEIHKVDLESIFLALTGKTLRD